MKEVCRRRRGFCRAMDKHERCVVIVLRHSGLLVHRIREAGSSAWNGHKMEHGTAAVKLAMRFVLERALIETRVQANG